MESSVMEDCSVWNAFTWEMKDFSKEVHNAGVFSAIGYKWCIRCILVQSDCIEEDCLDVYLHVTDLWSLPCGWRCKWSRSAEIRLSLINQIDSNLTHTKEAYHEFNSIDKELGFTDFFPLSKLRGGYIHNGTCIFKVVVALPRPNHRRKRVTQNEAVTKFEIQCVDDDSPLPGTNSRRSFIAPPPTNIPVPSSTLKNCSNIARTILQSFMSEFDSDFPTYEKFGKVMEVLRTMMYGGNMGDIFEEWRTHILEIETLLAEIEDVEQESKKENREAPLLEELSEILESLAQSEQVSKQAEDKMAGSVPLLDSNRQELQAIQEELAELRLQVARLESSERNIQEAISVDESVHAKSTSEKEEAEKKIKKLKQQKKDVTKNIEDVQAKAEVRVAALAEKKVAVQEWLSNPFPTAKNL